MSLTCLKLLSSRFFEQVFIYEKSDSYYLLYNKFYYTGIIPVSSLNSLLIWQVNQLSSLVLIGNNFLQFIFKTFYHANFSSIWFWY